MSTLSDIAAELAFLDKVATELSNAKKHGFETLKRWAIEELELIEKYASDDLISLRARRMIASADEPSDFYG